MGTKDCGNKAYTRPNRSRVRCDGWLTVMVVGAVAALSLMGGRTQAFAAGAADGSIGGLNAKFTEVDGIRTRYYEYGQGEPMVLVHGGFTANSSSANVFSRNIPGLAEHYHVFAMDRLASGLTGNPKDEKDYSVQGDIDFVFDFIKTMKLGQVHLVGHSAGGGIAMDFAIEHPEIVKTLTIIAAGPEDPPEFSGASKLTKPLEKCPDQSTYAGLKCRAGALAWLPDTFEEEYWRADEQMAMLPKAQDARRAMAAGAGIPVNGPAYTAWQEKLWDRVRKDGVLQMPVLMVAGSDDVLDWPEGSPNATLQRELGLFNIIAAKNSRVQMVVISNGGHFMYREHPEEFNADLIGFIEFWKSHPKAPAISGGQFDKPFYQ